MKESNTALFRIVAVYQYRENYGAHDWDGTGACPQYWKSKGGDEVIIQENLSIEDAIISLYTEETHVQAESHEYASEYATNHIIDIGIQYSGDPTQDEIINAYMMGIDLDVTTVPFTELDYTELNSPIDQYDLIAEQLGYLNA